MGVREREERRKSAILVGGIRREHEDTNTGEGQNSLILVREIQINNIE